MHIQKQPLVFALIILTLLVSACGGAAPTAPTALTLTDAYQRQVTIQAPAQRIVSLAPSNTEILFAIGAGAQTIARDSFSDFPAEAKSLTDIGGEYGKLNLEAIIAQKPDLVLASALTPVEDIQTMQSAGLTVFAVPNPVDFPGLYANLETVAQITGHQSEAARLIDSLKARVAAVTAKTASVTEKPVVLYELDSTDPNAPYIPGPGTFIDMLITQAGGANLGADMQGDWVQVSLESLIARDPDLIILGDATWGGVTPEMVTARSGWDALTAVKDGRVYPFDDNLVSRPGPRMVDGLEALAKLLHPELFK